MSAGSVTLAELKERYRRELWQALGFSPDQRPSSDWGAAINVVRRQTQQLADVRRVVR